MRKAKALYTFEQQECVDNAFTDKAGTNLLGGMTYNSAYAPESSGGKNKCPIVVKGGHTYERAHNGVSFSGLRQPSLTFPQYEFVESQSDISGLGLTNQITVEMWIRPTGLDGQDKNLVLFEIGKSGLAGSGENWQCGTDDFVAQLVFNDSPAEKKFEFTYRVDSGGCATAVFLSQNPMSNGAVNHVVLKTATTATTPRPWHIHVTQVGQSLSPFNRGSGFEPDMTSWNSTRTVKLGSSPAVLSSLPGSLQDMKSFPGDVLMFALYNRELNAAEIEQNLCHLE